MPTKLGEWCTRCGAKSVKTVRGDKLYYECPNKHGVQLIEDAPKEELPAEGSPAQDLKGPIEPLDLNERADDVSRAVEHGTGSHN